MHFKKVMHHVWAYFHARLAFTLAAFNVLVQRHGLQPNASGFVPVWSKYSNSPSYWRLRLYHRPHFGLSSAPLSPILSVNRDGKG